MGNGRLALVAAASAAPILAALIWFWVYSTQTDTARRADLCVLGTALFMGALFVAVVASNWFVWGLLV